MPFDLVFSYPIWYLLLCAGLAAVLSFVLYYSSKTAKNRLPRLWLILLSIFRFTTIFTLAFLLLNPLLKQQKTTEEKPLLLFVQDNSKSLISSRDSSFVKGEYLDKIQSLKKSLSSKYDIENLLLAKEVFKNDSLPSFSEKETNLSKIFSYTNNFYEGRPIGAIVLSSDGIYTNGYNPTQGKFDSKAPLYTIKIGDSTKYKDLILNSAKYNEVVFLGDEYPVRIEAQANKCKGNKSILTISEKGKTLFEKELLFTELDEFIEETIYLPAKKVGSIHLTVKLSSLENERSLSNNVKHLFFDVLDSRKKVKMIFSGPNPDVGAISRAIKANKNYSFTSQSYKDNLQLDKTDLLILHNLPNGDRKSLQIIQEAKTRKLPILFFIGTQNSSNILRNKEYGCNLYTNGSTTESQATINTNFSYFNVENKLAKSLSNWPPINAPHGRYGLSGSSQALMQQRIGSINTSKPLISMSKTTSGNYGILFGNGYWKWRMADYVANKNFETFDGLIGKIVQFLATHEDTRKFKVELDKVIFSEDEQVVLNAKLLNNNNEAINTKEVSIKIIHEAGKEYTYLFGKKGENYNLNAGILPIGNYTYKAKSALGHNFSGKFKVVPLEAELNNLSADFGMLNELAYNNGGKSFNANEISSLEKELHSNEVAQGTLYTENILKELINEKWLFFLLLLLLSLEWFIRKREGAY